MNDIIDVFKKITDFLLGWLEILFYRKLDYKYVIENIESVKNNHKTITMIRYKVAGSRVPATESAINLNKTHIFSLFRPDHAQIIVSIATIEAFLNYSPDQVIQKYEDYISLCSLKINERRRI